MDPALLRTIQSGIDEKELDKTDIRVVEVLVTKLQMYSILIYHFRLYDMFLQENSADELDITLSHEVSNLDISYRNHKNMLS